MEANYIESTSGFIVIGDIAGFSNRVNDLQRELVRHLWTFLNQDSVLTEPSKNQVILNGTGDGALVAFPRNADPSRNDGRVIHWEKVVEFAKRWIDWMSQDIDGEGAKKRLRIGIHEGRFQIINVAQLGGVAQHGNFQVAGSGPNICARLTGLGDAGDIVMSETFINSWKDSSKVNAKDFDPALTGDPLRVFVKHGVPLYVRRLRRKGPRPEKLAEIQIVNDQLRVCLEQVETLFLFWINLGLVSRSQFQRDSLSARVSLWTEDKKNKRLNCYPVRWHHGNRVVTPSETKYPTRGKGAGPAGRAFCSNEPFILTGLPEVDRSDQKTLERYCAKLFQRTGLRADVSRNFSTYSRSFICYPIGLRADRPDAVVCIDSEQPLSAVISSANLKSIAATLKAASNTALAAMLRLNR